MARKTAEWVMIFAIVLGVLIMSIVLNVNRNLDIATRLDDSLNIDEGDLGIDWSNYPVTDIALTASIELTQSGVYHLTGTLYDGVISINVGQNYPVKLILDNVSIYHSNGPAIICYATDNLTIELVGENTVIDGSAYADSYDEEVTGAIYSKSDLAFVGDGTLNLTANHADGIVSKDDLTFRAGTYSITAADDAIRGKDSVRIADGSFKLNATADAIKTTNDTDAGKGFVLIENGNFNITAGDKGIQATNVIVTRGGNFAITTTDDSIHSDHYVGIESGTFNINAGDDAIHANRELEIKDGDIAITKAYEGLEAQKITIDGGTINIAANDDGINAGGGADNSATNRTNKSPFDADENCMISINGGDIYVNAAGDGIDSNGWLYINGGSTIIDGPTNDGNGALDAGMGIIINGGGILALGSSGMAEAPSQASSVNSISVYLGQNYPAGTKVEIVDEAGNVFASHVSAKMFSHLVVGTPSFQLGDTYTLYLDDEKYTDFTISGIVTTLGNTNRTMPGRR